jgi:hypothetical protein
VGADAHDLAAHLHEVEGLLHAGRGVHRVARQHGLHDDRMMAAADDAAVGGIADDNLAGLAAVEKIRGFAVAHGQSFKSQVPSCKLGNLTADEHR